MANSTGQSPASSCSAPLPSSTIPSHSSSSSSSLILQGPCAACKFLRRRCAHNCLLAPYFPRNDPLKFIIAHKVFGASNIIKMLQELPEESRADAVNSMVYEANARIRDPVYGCTGAICLLQKQINELQAELAKAKAEIFNVQSQNDNLLSVISMGITTTTTTTSSHHHHHHQLQPSNNSTWYLDDQSNNDAYAPGIYNVDNFM